MSNNPHFANNSALYPSYNSANQVSLGTNNVNETFNGSASADSFQLFAASRGTDAIANFASNDTLAVDHFIFDGNKDGYIDLGSNHVLDVDRTGTGNKNAGHYQVAIHDAAGHSVDLLRYMGTKSGENVYGAASTRDQLLGHFASGSDSTHGVTGGDALLKSIAYRIDDTVGDNTYDAGKGSTALLIDNATGLNFGSNTINNFGNDDLLILTADVYKHKSDAQVGFGTNKVLDLSAQTPTSNDPNGGPGGQLDVNGVGHDIQTLKYLGSETLGTGSAQATYYFYGTSDHAAVPGLALHV